MKTKLIICLVLVFHLTPVGATSADTLCEKYRKGFERLESGSPVAKKNLQVVFAPNPATANQYDPSWYYLDLGEFVLPVPENPKKLTRESDGTVVVSSSHFTAVIGTDVSKEALDPIRAYANARKIQSDYDFNLFLYSDVFAKCDDLKVASDVENKLSLAIVKSLFAPFELMETFRFSQTQAIILAGRHRSNKKFSTNIIVRKSTDSSVNGMLFFETKEDQTKFHSYVSKIRTKDFFKSGKALKL